MSLLRTPAERYALGWRFASLVLSVHSLPQRQDAVKRPSVQCAGPYSQPSYSEISPVMPELNSPLYARASSDVEHDAYVRHHLLRQNSRTIMEHTARSG